MADDFLKQLQLSKQIEQKAKEAAQNRKAAELKLAEAEESIKKAKANGDDVVEAEKLMADAQASFKEKNYKYSLDQATRSIHSVSAAQALRLETTIVAIEGLTALLEGRAAKSSTYGKDLEVIKTLGSEAKYDEANHLAGKMLETLETTARDLTVASHGRAKVLLINMQDAGMEVTEERTSLENAKEKMQWPDLKDSLLTIETDTASLRKKMADLFEERANGIMQMQSLDAEGLVDFSHSNGLLEAARNKLGTEDVKGCLADLDSAEQDTRHAIKVWLDRTLSSMVERTVFLKEEGSPTSQQNIMIDAIRVKIEQEEFGSAKDQMDELRGMLNKAESAVLAEKVSQWATKLLIARTVGADMAEVAKRMETAREATQQGDLRRALEISTQARKDVDEGLKGYADTMAQLEEYHVMLRRAEALRLNTSSSAKIATQARRAARTRDFKKATSLLKDSTRELQSSVQANYGKEVIRIEMTLANAIRMEADVSEESEALDKLVDNIKRNEFGIVETELQRLNRQAEERLRDSAFRVVEETRSSIDRYSGPMDLNEARTSLRKATEALEVKNYNAAYDLAVQAKDVLVREEIQLLEIRLAEAGRLLAIMKELECESITLKEKYHKSLELRTARNYGEAVKATEEVLQFSISIIKDELSRQMTNVGKAISISRKKGIGVVEPEKLMEDAWRLLNASKIEESYNVMQQAMEQLRQANQRHQDTYNLIASVRTLIREAGQRNLDTSKIEVRLEKAQALFEAEKYDEARTVAKVAHQEAERLAAPFITPKRLSETNELAALARRMKLDISKAEDMLARAEDLLAVQDYLRALGSIKEANDLLNAIIAEGLSRDIAACKQTIVQSREKGQDVTTAEIVIQKGEAMLQEGELMDASRAIEMAKSELDQATFMEQRSANLLRQAGEGIHDVSELGLDVSAAREVLKQATLFHKQGNFTLATELGKKAYGLAADAAEKAILKSMSEAEERSQLIGLGGTEMASVAAKKERIMEMVRQRRFKDALFLIGPLEEEMRGLMRQREQSERELDDLEARAKALEEAGMFTDNARQLLYRAREKFQEGAFSESLSLISRCKDDMASITEMHESRQKELRTLQEEVAYIEDHGRRKNLQGLLENAEAALRKLDFERTSLYLRRARAALLEATGYEVGRYFEELMTLGKVAERAGLKRQGQDQKNGQFTKMYDIRPKDLQKLRTEVEAMRAALSSELKERSLRLREELGRAKGNKKDVSASTAKLEAAESALAAQDFEASLELLLDGSKYIGVGMEDLQAFETVARDLESILGKIKAQGLEVIEEEKELARLREQFPREPQRTKKDLDGLHEAQGNRLAGLVPNIKIDIDFLDVPKLKRWCKVVFRVSNQGTANAKSVSLRLSGPVETQAPLTVAWLAPKESVSLRAELMPKGKGNLTVTLSMACSSGVDGKDCGYDTDFEMLVE